MTTLLIILLWVVLFVISWPLALLALVLLPLLWLCALPFRLLFWVLEATLALIKAVLFLPARLLGYRSNA